MASLTTVIKDILAIVGGVGAIVGTGVGIWLGLKKRAEHKQKELEDGEKKAKDKLNSVAFVTDRLTADTTKIQDELKSLTTAVAGIQTRCVAHGQGQALGDIKDDVEKIRDRLEKLYDELRKYYLQSSTHHNDMTLINSSIETLRKQVDAIHNNLLAIYAKK